MNWLYYVLFKKVNQNLKGRVGSFIYLSKSFNGAFNKINIENHFPVYIIIGKG